MAPQLSRPILDKVDQLTSSIRTLLGELKRLGGKLRATESARNVLQKENERLQAEIDRRDELERNVTRKLTSCLEEIDRSKTTMPEDSSPATESDEPGVKLAEMDLGKTKWAEFASPVVAGLENRGVEGGKFVRLEGGRLIMCKEGMVRVEEGAAVVPFGFVGEEYLGCRFEDGSLYSCVVVMDVEVCVDEVLGKRGSGGVLSLDAMVWKAILEKIEEGQGNGKGEQEGGTKLEANGEVKRKVVGKVEREFEGRVWIRANVEGMIAGGIGMRGVAYLKFRVQEAEVQIFVHAIIGEG